jgi:hypothetical protein
MNHGLPVKRRRIARTTFSWPDGLHEQAVRLAKEENRSLGNMIETLIKEALVRRNGKRPPK